MKQLLLICTFLLLSACSSPPNSPVQFSESEQLKLDPTNPHPQDRRTQIAPGAIIKPTTETAQADLDNLGPAPELNNQTWLNVEQPLRLADLRGSVVLLDMWTFG